MTTDRPALPSEADIMIGLREELTAVLASVEPDLLGLDALGRDTPLLSLPLDSLRLAETMTRIEDRFRVFIPEQRAFAFTTIGDVADYVQEKAAAKAARAVEKSPS